MSQWKFISLPSKVQEVSAPETETRDLLGRLRAAVSVNHVTQTSFLPNSVSNIRFYLLRGFIFVDGLVDGNANNSESNLGQKLRKL